MEVALLAEYSEQESKSNFTPSWPFSDEIAATRASYDDEEFGTSGLVYAFDYTLRFDAVSQSLIPCIFEVQSLNDSVVSFLRATDKHYSQSKANNRVKQKFLQEISVDKFTIKDHIPLNKAKQRTALAEGNCQDLQMPHKIIEAITDLESIDVRYHQLVRQRNEQIAKFLAENSGCDFVLKRSEAARGEGNAFISREELAKHKEPWRLVTAKMADLEQDAEFSLEVAVESYKAMTDENVTFRAIMAIDDEGSFRGVKQWANLHDSFSSHKRNSRHYFLEGVKDSAKVDEITTRRGTKLEPSVEHHLGRAASAIKRASERELGKAENTRLLKKQITFSAPKTLYPTTLDEYMAALSHLFTERKTRCCGLLPPKILKPLPLLAAEDAAKDVDLSGKAAANFTKVHLVNLVRDAATKGSRKLTEIASHLNSVGCAYSDFTASKGYYKIKKLLAEMMIDDKNHYPKDRELTPEESFKRKAEILALTARRMTAKDLADFITNHDAAPNYDIELARRESSSFTTAPSPKERLLESSSEFSPLEYSQLSGPKGQVMSF